MEEPSSYRTNNSSTNLLKRTKNCYKLPNSSLTDQIIEECKENTNSCLNIWEFSNIENMNITQLVESSKLKVKGKFSFFKCTKIRSLLIFFIFFCIKTGCWNGHILEKNGCHLKPSANISRLICYCINENNCNKNDLPDPKSLKELKPLPTRPTPIPNVKPNVQTNQSQLLFICIPVLLVLIILTYFFYKRCMKIEKKFSTNQTINITIDTQEPLIKKSTPKIINLLKKGQYGTVYKGKIERNSQSTEQLVCRHEGQQINDQEQTVAIKVYPKELYLSFKHEYDVYNLPHFKHKNILKYISSEERPNSSSYPGYWLVLEYYENGSLYDYLRYNLINYSQLLEISLNIASGLSHLHYNVACAVVHRDLKSKNILLKSDLTACISDFNLALVLYPNQQQNEPLGQVGTVR